MKFTVSSSGLLSHIQAISRVISNKNTLAILDNFLFKIEGDMLTATASDSETTLVTTVQLIASDSDGAFALSAKHILDILKEFPEQPLNFDVEGNRIQITSDTGEFSISASDAIEYPTMQALDQSASTSIMISVSNLEKGLAHSIFATADDELRPVMNGVFFDIKSDSLTFAASDAHKLARMGFSGIKADQESSFILHKKPANLLKTILAKEDGNVIIDFDNKNASFTLSSYKMVCRLVEGRYPNYNSVIPQGNPNRMTIDRQKLITSLKRVAVCSNQSSNLVKLAVEDNLLTLSAQDIDFSISAKETVACEFSGEPVSIGFKSNFLVEILQNISSPDVVFELADSSRAGVITPFENNANEDVLMLLMPMMLND